MPWSRSGAGRTPAPWGTWAGAPPRSTPPSRSAAPWCAPIVSWSRPGPGSWRTPTRRASSPRPRQKPQPCCERSRARSRETPRYRPVPIGVYFRIVFKLLSTSGDQSIDLAPGRTLVVGRAVTSDVPIYDPTISRRHAEITLVASGVRVKDLGSSNGTFLNGARITQADAGANDVVTFGKVAFKVAGITPPARPSTPTPEASQTGGSRAMPKGTNVRQLPVSASSGEVKAESETERREKKLELLLEISKELSRQQELDQLLHKVVDVTFQIMNVDRVSILLLDGKTKELVPKVSRSRTGDTNAAKLVPQSIARKA